MIERWRRWTAPILVLAATGLLSACITIDVGGGGRGEMHETVVLGEKGPKVLMIDIDGEITDADASGVLGWVLSEGTVSRVQDELDRAEKQQDIAAILLRIDSPGGSPTASDAVYRQLMRFKKAHGIPVYAQFMSVAASGGYYVAMAADKVMAAPTSITGSIGVLMLGVNLSGLMEKVGVDDQTITSGPYKDAGSWLRPMKPAERAQLKSVVDDLYDRFLTVVDQGRPDLSAAKVRELADGRVYSAPQAKEAGLIDEISDLEDTIERVRERLGTEQIRVVSFHRPRDIPTNIYSRTTVHAPVEVEPDVMARFVPRPGFYYLWWPAAQ